MPHTPRQREGHKRHYILRRVARSDALRQGVRLTEAEERAEAKQRTKEPLPLTRAFFERYLSREE